MTGSEVVGRLGWVQVDCRDPEHLAAFWSAVLGTGVRGRLGNPPQYVTLEAAGAGSPRLVFQRVPEAKVVKNRVHLDLEVHDIEDATERVVRLGATRQSGDDYDEAGMRWRVMLDPEGNEFCLVTDDPGEV